MDRLEKPSIRAIPRDPVHCRICGYDNLPVDTCRHVRWTFEQGGPIEFARYALHSSPYIRGRGFDVLDIPSTWWNEHGDWIVDEVALHFDVNDGYVFGEVADLDMLARSVWKEFRPDPAERQPLRF